MALTPNIGLTLPVVGSDNSWAAEINADLQLIDAHDHTSGKGLQLGAAALNVNADLPMQGNNLNHVQSVTFSARTPSSVLTPLSLFCDGTDLFFSDGNANTVRLTQGGKLLQPLPGAFYIGASTVLTSTTTISSTDPHTVYFCNMASASSFTVTLPTVTSSNGRVIVVKDTGSASGSKVITVAPQSGQYIDVSSTSKTITTAHGILRLVCDGAKWWVW